MTVPSGSAPSIGWPRAVAAAITLSLLLTLLLMVIPHWILTVLPFGSRGVRVTLATGWIAAATVAIIVAGRRRLAPTHRDQHAQTAPVTRPTDAS